MKKVTVEIYDPQTGQWSLEERTEEELQQLEEEGEVSSDVDIIMAEHKIVKRSIEIQLGQYTDKKSMD